MDTKTLFIAFVVAVALGIASAIVRYFPAKTRLPALGAFSTWLVYIFVIGRSGILADTTRRPPGLAFFLVPMLLTFLAIGFRPTGRDIATSLPLALLIGAQAFRVIVELFLHQLWLDGALPKMMTYQGVNFDIFVGGSALLLAGLLMTRSVPSWILKAWNIVGILMVLNVAVRGVLTVPGPLRMLTDDVPNTGVVTFPYTFIPSLMVPMAICLHILSLRHLSAASKHAS